MKLRIRDLVRWEGTIDGPSYALVGVVLTLVKRLLDWIVAHEVFGREWSLFRYVIPSETFGIVSLPPADQWFYATMAMLALPFIWIGVLLTIKRLRDIPLPRWLVLLFFAPIPINLIFFVVLSLLSQEEGVEPSSADGGLSYLPFEEVGTKPKDEPDFLDRLLPTRGFFRALVCVLLPVPFAVALGALSIGVFENYGWGIFLGVPFALPAISVMLYGHHYPMTRNEALSLGATWMLVMFGSLFGFAFEGAICLIMALPLVAPIVFMGTVVGYLIQRRPKPPREFSRLLLALLAVLPGLIGAEGIAARGAPVFAVRTAVEISAPPERVWRHVVEFSDLPAPDDWTFKTGIAYPIRAEIVGRGPGAVRHCVFSTGPFVEPIEVWDEPRLLRFAVTDNPPPMKEWSPIADIHPPHLDGYLVSRRGQFRLSPLPGGRTRLEGTTWYQNHMQPAAYWRIWSDGIIRRIHLQVLRHVKHLAESGSRSN